MGAGNINNDYARVFLADLFTLFSFGSSGDRSNLKCAVARFDISRGLASARQLVIETRGATIIGKGTVNLATEGLDLHMAPYATSTNLSTLAIPMTIRGTITNPQVNPDTAAIPGHTVGAVVTAPLTALSTIGNAVGIGGSGEDALCGASAPATPGTTSQAPQQPTSPIEGLLNGVGSGAKDASDALKSLFP
jgi:AsmA family protein